MAGDIEARLKALDLVLPEAKAAIATYVPFLHLDGNRYVREGEIEKVFRISVLNVINLDLIDSSSVGYLIGVVKFVRSKQT